MSFNFALQCWNAFSPEKNGVNGALRIYFILSLTIWLYLLFVYPKG